MFGDLHTAKVTATATGIDANPMAAIKSVPTSRNRKQHFAMRFDGYFRAPTRTVYSFQANGAAVAVSMWMVGR